MKGVILLAGLAALAGTAVLQAQEIGLYNPQTLYDEPGGLFDTELLRTMFVDFEDPGYHSTLVNAFFENPGLRIPATVILDDLTVDSVAVRYKGNSTFCLPNDAGSPKLPYNLDFNYWNESSEMMGYHKLKLANAWLDPTFAKEYVAALVYRRYLPTPEVNLMALHTQNEYTGLYVNTESINGQFLKKHFGENDGPLFKCDPAGVFCIDTGENYSPPSLHWLGEDSASYYNSYALKSEQGWAELQDLTYTINFDGANVAEKLNVDRVLWALAVNQVISNLDTYNGYYIHNYYMYLAENGLWQMIPWDFDNAFIGAILGWEYFAPVPLYEYDPYDGAAVQEDKPLTNLLLNDPLYRKQYVAHIRTIVNESLDLAAIEAEVNSLQSLAIDAATADDNKLFSMGQFSQNVAEALWSGWGFAGILSTADARRDYLLSLPEIAEVGPEIGLVELAGPFSDGASDYHEISASVAGATMVTLMATTSEFNSHFEPYPMTDDGGNTYTAQLPFSLDEQSEWKFYIRAETETAMRLSPARAEYEFYHYTSPVGGIAELGQTSDVQVELFPNPTSGAFSIRGVAEVSTVTVFDVGGRMTYAQPGGAPISVEGWKPGVYLVEVEASNGHRAMERLVVCD